MTKIQNSKPDDLEDLRFGYCNLFEIWCLQFVVSGLSGLGSTICTHVAGVISAWKPDRTVEKPYELVDDTAGEPGTV